ncbi:ABC-2 type transport system ATP-binding protein [Bowdeniella nasicola]|uniref:ABC-2 type transport system ATP-binding protein n=1 Tax=Bowdeniella nasicola TaxID=208480 RepID=A0A1H3Y265_9ACTO|nr:ABC transporter ATP-binding protein [Bowdeniella nasicola]SEA05817.1 ABC-2 type transport system ATP-binding protein [Bowdeniella nasicola]
MTTPEGSVTPALRLDSLTKDFDGRLVVNELSLDIPPGSFYGIVGPNGAGKTTTLSMATGLLRPTRGHAYVAGIDVWADPPAAKAHMGVLADEMATFDRLTGRELLTYTGLLHRLAPDVVDQRCDELLQALDLGRDGAKQVADYSAGMRKKILLATALIAAPRLLILDEPFESVDPVSARTMREILAAYVDGGGTVVISSHVMELVETMCDHVAIIHEGRVRAAGTLAEVRGELSLVDRFIELVGAKHLAEGSLTWLRS